VPPLAELGLAALHGSSPDVGIVGYSLGGGLGWLARSHGLQCNSVTAIELVTADGDLIRCDAVHEPELFWALRGGGGNFGIVTAIEFSVYPLTQVYAGAMFFAYDRAAEVIGTWQAMLPGLPRELMSQASIMHLPDLPFVPEPLRGGSFAVIIAAFTGSESEGRRRLAPIRALGPAIDTFAIAGPDALAQLSMDPPEPLPYASTHALLGDLTAEAIDALVAAAGPSCGIAALQLRHLGGALTAAPAGAGARATLGGRLAMFAAGLVLDEATAAAVGGALRRIAAAGEPHRVGAYASFVEEPADAAGLFDPATWERLRAVKALYDPADLIRANHHVPPAR
jgi:FAD/FMN-containing dehydrogenase